MGSSQAFWSASRTPGLAVMKDCGHQVLKREARRRREARPDLSAGGEPDAVASVAEVVRHGADEAELEGPAS